ncbi:hypothetical protein Esti_002792 [Eimeria stiedai]
MPLEFQVAAQMRNGLLACAALLLLVSSDVHASSSWAASHQPGSFPPDSDLLVGGWSQPQLQPSGAWAFPADQSLLYTTTAPISLPGRTTPSGGHEGTRLQSSAPLAVPAQRVTLEDLPVESEGPQEARGASALVGPGQDTKQKSSLRSALANLLRRPTLEKIVVVIAVFAASFFLRSRVLRGIAGPFQLLCSSFHVGRWWPVERGSNGDVSVECVDWRHFLEAVLPRSWRFSFLYDAHKLLCRIPESLFLHALNSVVPRWFFLHIQPSSDDPFEGGRLR